MSSVSRAAVREVLKPLADADANEAVAGRPRERDRERTVCVDHGRQEPSLLRLDDGPMVTGERALHRETV